MVRRWRRAGGAGAARRPAPAVELLEERNLLSGARFTTTSLPAQVTDHLSSDLVALVAGQTGATLRAAGTGAFGAPQEGVTANWMQFDTAGRVEVDISAKDVLGLEPYLTPLGFQATAADPSLHLLEGYLPSQALVAATGLSAQGLLGISAAARPMTAAGLVDSQGDNVLEADRVRATLPAGYDGTGVKVGILSDSYNQNTSAATHAAQDIASGDLPAAGVTVLQDGPPGSEDEGRAMLQIVHDLAPGATLGFSSAFFGQADFAQQIRNLADPAQFGAKVIGDDIFYFDEPMFQDGVIAQAINDVVTNKGVSYVSLAGNLGDQAYESTHFTTAPDGDNSGIDPPTGNYYNFNPDSMQPPVTRQNLTIANGQAVIMELQWADPFYTTNGVHTDLDFFLTAHDGPNAGQVVAFSNSDNIASQIPLERFSFTNDTSVTGTTSFDLEIQLFAGPAPSRVKWVNFGANNFGPITVNTFPTHSPTVIPHAAAANALAVAADPFFDQRNPESYSSLGPSTILFNPDGTPLAAPQVRNKPDVAAIDGVSTTFFGGLNTFGDGLYNFFGTSAATPHAAAVAALVLQAHPGDTPAQVYAALKSSADPNIGGTPGDPNKVGAGLIDAYRAIYGAPVPQALNVTDGFESGALAKDWEVYNAGSGRTQVTTANGPAHGSSHLVMDSNVATDLALPGLSEAVLHVNAANAANFVTLTFNEKEFNDPDDPMPASFTGHGNYDGVAFSVDGTTWYRLVSLTGPTSTNTYKSFTVNLSQAAATLGLTLGADVRLKFQHYNARSGMAPNRGFAFDDVAVTTGAGVVVQNGNLVVYGTGGSDNIAVSYAHGAFGVAINGVHPAFDASQLDLAHGHVIIYGLDGNDQITMQGVFPAEIHAGNGSTVVHGGDGGDVIYGGTSAGARLTAYAGAGNDVLIGDAGTATLYGGRGHSILIGGTVTGYSYAMLTALAAEWAAGTITSGDETALKAAITAGVADALYAGSGGTWGLATAASFTGGWASPHKKTLL